MSDATYHGRGSAVLWRPLGSLSRFAGSKKEVNLMGHQSSLWLHMLSTSVWTLVCTVLATCRLALSIFDIKYLESHDIIEYMATYVQLQ